MGVNDFIRVMGVNDFIRVMGVCCLATPKATLNNTPAYNTIKKDSSL